VVPDVVHFEGQGEHAATVKRLEQMGHKLRGTRQGDGHSIRVDPKAGLYYGAEDRRIGGKVASY
jgi:gamma-glutamyltranspeptidase